MHRCRHGFFLIAFASLLGGCFLATPAEYYAIESSCDRDIQVNVSHVEDDEFVSAVHGETVEPYLDASVLERYSPLVPGEYRIGHIYPLPESAFQTQKARVVISILNSEGDVESRFMEVNLIPEVDGGGITTENIVIAGDLCS